MSCERLLITNDDGIESHFLGALVDAHLEANFEVTVAAPLSEQSWIARAMTREGEVEVTRYTGFNCEAWAIDGTPTDCVNIALGHLIPEAQRPHAVISGINLGQNAAHPFILSSGTIAGALEGVLWGLPGIAYSHLVAHEDYEPLRVSKGKAEGMLADSLACAAQRAVELTRQLMAEPLKGLTVHNVNFPLHTTLETPVEMTFPEQFHGDTLFEKASENIYRFRFNNRMKTLLNHPATDRACIRDRGHISHTRLDYAKLADQP